MRSAADDMQMMYMPADNVQACRWCADDMQMMSGWHMSSTSWNLQRSLTSISSVRHPHVIRALSAHHLHATSVPRLFSVKEQNSSDKKNSPIKGWGGLSKMSKKMSMIELSRIGQDLFDFSDLIWGHPLTHSSTHRYLQTKSNYINKFKLYYISHLTWPHPLTHPLIHIPTHSCGCLNKS